MIHDKVIDLDAFLDQLPDVKAQIYPTLLQGCRYDGALKMIPMFYNVPFIFYRPDLFRQAGLPEPTPDWTWDDYRRDAKALTQRAPDGAVTMYGTNVQATWWVEWLGLIRQAGGDMLAADGSLKINSPGTQTAVEFMHDLIYEDKSAPTLRDTLPNGFISGKVAIYYGGHVMELAPLRDHAPFEWDIAPLPVGPAGRAVGDLAVSGLAVSRQCKHPEAALEIIRFLQTKPVALELARGGITPPVRRDIAQETLLAGTPETRTIRPKHAEVLVDCLAYAQPNPKLKDFAPVANCVRDGITHALNDPDRSHIAALPQSLGDQCQVLLDLGLAKKPTSLAFFAIQLIVLIALAAWFLHLYFKHNRNTAEENAGQKFFFLFTAPCLLGLLLFRLGPLVMCFWWAQTDYNMVDPSHYIGLAQYHTLLFKDPDFWHSLELSLVYAIFAVPLGLAVSLFTAILLNQDLRHIGIFRVLFYLPSILPVAASGMMWVWILNPEFGVINRTLAALGIEGPGWIQDPHWALASLIFISAWGFGGGMLIFLAGLKNIPASLYEAAEIDGAGMFSKFLHITLPSISPVLFFNLTMGCIGALQVFDIAYIVSSGGAGGADIGGPERSTFFYILNLYVKSFVNLDIGAGSAMAWLFFIVIIFITCINFWAKKYWIAPESERA